MSTLVKTPVFPSFPGFFDDFISRDIFGWNEKNFATIGSTFPSVNLKETDKEFKIELAAPGLKKDDFKVELYNGMLTISSEKKEEKENKDKDGNFLRREFSYESFTRSFSMPENIKEDSVDAVYSDGILHISIGKKAPKDVINHKTVEIK